MIIATVRFQFLINEVQCQVHQDREDMVSDQEDEEEDLVDVMVQWAEQDQTTMHMEIITLHMVVQEYLEVYHMILRVKVAQMVQWVTMVSAVVVVAAEGTTIHTTTIILIIIMRISLFIITIPCTKIRYTIRKTTVHFKYETAILTRYESPFRLITRVIMRNFHRIQEIFDEPHGNPTYNQLVNPKKNFVFIRYHEH